MTDALLIAIAAYEAGAPEWLALLMGHILSYFG